MLLVAAVRAELGDLAGTELGIGPIAAAAAAARVLATERPRAVVLVGSAGAYPGGPAIGAAVVARRVGFGSGTATLGRGYVPAAPPPLSCDPGLVARATVPSADVLCTTAITTDPELVARFAADWQVEHLEAYAVAHACHAAGVPFVAFLGIANEVGPHAHAQWLAHRGAAEHAARSAVRALLA